MLWLLSLLCIIKDRPVSSLKSWAIIVFYKVVILTENPHNLHTYNMSAYIIGCHIILLEERILNKYGLFFIEILTLKLFL